MTAYKPYIPRKRQQPTITLTLPSRQQAAKAAIATFAIGATLAFIALVAYAKSSQDAQYWAYGGADFEAFLESIDTQLPAELPAGGGL
jgi:hypothetical protein